MAIRTWISQGTDPISGAIQYRSGDLVVLFAREAGRFHLSISHLGGRYPTWDEIADARYDLMPNDCDCAILLPPTYDYLNIKGNVFHVWEIKDSELPIERGMAMKRTYENGLAPR